MPGGNKAKNGPEGSGDTPSCQPPPLSDSSILDFGQTPLFRAFQADRYARQEIIRETQRMTGRYLIVYEANEARRGSSITSDDVEAFSDLIHRLPDACKLDLMINSTGGDVEAAEKIIYMCRNVASAFRVIVPELAKSAATLVALGSDEVVMGLQSELGPIDAQLFGPGPGGAMATYSAQSFVDAFDRIKDEVKDAEPEPWLSPAYYPLLQDLNIGFLELCRNLAARSREFATKWLKKHMCKNDEQKAKGIAEALCDVKRWRTHGSMIDAEEADNLGITVDRKDRHDPLWKAIWFLHCCYRTAFQQSEISKLFESEQVSLAFQ